MISTTGRVIASLHHYHTTAFPLTLGLLVVPQVYIYIIIIWLAAYSKIGISCASLGPSHPGRILLRM